MRTGTTAVLLVCVVAATRTNAANVREADAARNRTGDGGPAARNSTGDDGWTAAGNSTVGGTWTTDEPVAGDDAGNRSARQADERDQRCAALQESDGEEAAVLEATRTVDRYRLRPAAAAAAATYYENPVVYRERPAAAAVYVRRRRPVLVMDRLQRMPPIVMAATASPAAAAVDLQYYYEEAAAAAGPVQAVRGQPMRIGLPYVQRFVPANRRDDDEVVNLSGDEVRRVLQRVFSEGVIAGEAAAATAKLAKD